MQKSLKKTVKKTKRRKRLAKMRLQHKRLMVPVPLLPTARQEPKTLKTMNPLDLMKLEPVKPRIPLTKMQLKKRKKRILPIFS